MSSQVVFQVQSDDRGTAEIMPVVDGRTLLEIVTEYERGRGYSPAGGYAGLIPDHFNFGDLSLYCLGRDNKQWPRPGALWLLGCDCGEVGCWPLEAKITAIDNHIVWSEFRQPYRDQWDYASFGPFTFERERYEAAVAQMVRQIESR